MDNCPLDAVCISYISYTFIPNLYLSVCGSSSSKPWMSITVTHCPLLVTLNILHIVCLHAGVRGHVIEGLLVVQLSNQFELLYTWVKSAVRQCKLWKLIWKRKSLTEPQLKTFLKLNHLLNISSWKVTECVCFECFHFTEPCSSAPLYFTGKYCTLYSNIFIWMYYSLLKNKSMVQNSLASRFKEKGKEKKTVFAGKTGLKTLTFLEF